MASSHRYCFYTTVKAEKLDLYKDHHDNIFPEVAAGLRKAGVLELYIWRLTGTNQQVMYINMTTPIAEALGEGSRYLTEDPVVPLWENLMKSFFEKDEWAGMDEIHASDKQWDLSVAGKLKPLAPHPSASGGGGAETEIVALTQSLLDSIALGNFELYNSLVADDLTCFEPEACGHLVEGKARAAPPPLPVGLRGTNRHTRRELHQIRGTGSGRCRGTAGPAAEANRAPAAAAA